MLEKFANQGPVFLGLMLHSWVALAASVFAVIVVIILIRKVGDSALGRPLFLMSFGVFADAFAGIMLPLELNVKFMWFFFLLANIFILFGIIWIAHVLGVFKLLRSKIGKRGPNGKKA